MTFARQRLGHEGEDLACAELERRGYLVLTRNHRSRFGEIDIVARDGDTVVFVEVKARLGGEFGNPAEAVTPRKQQRLVAMAEEYVSRYRLHDTPCRFDVVAVETGMTPPRITLYKDAFRPGW